MMLDIEVGDAIGCRVRNTGQPGVLHYDRDSIWVEFVGFGDHVRIDAKSPIYLHTAKSSVVTLLQNIWSGPRGDVFQSNEVGRVFHDSIASNLAISGKTAWAEDALAGSVSFRVGPECDFLSAPDIAKDIAEVSMDENPAGTIVELETFDGLVSIGYSLVGDMVRRKWSPTEIWISIRFTEPQSPRECLARVVYLISMFSLLTWRDFRAEEVWITQAVASERVYPHRILLTDRGRADSKREGRDPLVLISAETAADREALRGSLQVWLERRREWSSVVSLATTALRQTNVVSPERTLDACRWYEVLERTIGDAPAKGMPDAMRDVISTAILKARERGLADYEGWIAGRLSEIQGEPRKVRLANIAKAINEKYDWFLFDDAGVALLIQAYAVRHRTGHGTVDASTDDETSDLWGSAAAMETLCALRTMADLPLLKERRNFGNHALFGTYFALRDEKALRMAKEAQQER